MMTDDAFSFGLRNCKQKIDSNANHLMIEFKYFYQKVLKLEIILY
jgi:hypothetical protein